MDQKNNFSSTTSNLLSGANRNSSSLKTFAAPLRSILKSPTELNYPVNTISVKSMSKSSERKIIRPNIGISKPYESYFDNEQP